MKAILSRLQQRTSTKQKPIAPANHQFRYNQSVERRTLTIARMPPPNEGDIDMRAVQLTAYGNPVEGLKWSESCICKHQVSKNEQYR